MLDIGTIGFIVWAMVILSIMRLSKRIQKAFAMTQTDANEQNIYRVRQSLNIGFFVLLIMGMFLHVFEDSMVNYLFFIIR